MLRSRLFQPNFDLILLDVWCLKIYQSFRFLKQVVENKIVIIDSRNELLDNFY